ncbi:MAG: hypothetical protein NPMRTHETA2_1820002 [Nitrosopumilales archaeon]|nr:MAG: hypothetical protein NPMRTHETA2_1820002 [Nitrosopumilales archaeon]
MSILKPNRNIKKDFEKIKKISSLVEKKLEEYKHKNDKRIEKLTLEQLQDLNEILRITDFILTKHEAKKEFYSLLKEFVDIINKSAGSVEILDDEIGELIISAESTITRIKDLQGMVSKNYDFESKSSNEAKSDTVENSANNLTNSTTAVYI